MRSTAGTHQILRVVKAARTSRQPFGDYAQVHAKRRAGKITSGFGRTPQAFKDHLAKLIRESVPQ